MRRNHQLKYGKNSSIHHILTSQYTIEVCSLRLVEMLVNDRGLRLSKSDKVNIRLQGSRPVSPYLCGRMSTHTPSNEASGILLDTRLQTGDGGKFGGEFTVRICLGSRYFAYHTFRELLRAPAIRFPHWLYIGFPSSSQDTQRSSKSFVS